MKDFLENYPNSWWRPSALSIGIFFVFFIVELLEIGVSLSGTLYTFFCMSLVSIFAVAIYQLYKRKLKLAFKNLFLLFFIGWLTFQLIEAFFGKPH